MVKIQICGNLTADATLSDRAQNCCNFTVAADTCRMVKGKPKTEFYRVTVWGKRAEACAQYMKKGDRAFVAGDLFTDEYIGRDDEKHISLNINNADVQFFGKASQSRYSEPAEEDDASLYGL